MEEDERRTHPCELLMTRVVPQVFRKKEIREEKHEKIETKMAA